ncbi:MAG: ABC transporter permease [Gemmatimonadales bacterium]|nr:MAG: ABC transporter permease [Gemmatimonadales bacterium]
MRALWNDLILSLRSLRKEPGSALIASLTLALGIGLCSAAFSLGYGVFMRGLDVPEADRITLIYRSNPDRDQEFMSVTQHDLADWREQQTSFEGLAAYRTGTINLSGTEGPERYNGGFVSANMFDQLRVQPILGSGFRQGDDNTGAPLTLVLGHDVWVNRYASDPAVIGRAVIVNGEAATILGVMPEGFKFPQNQQLWIAARDGRAALTSRDQGVQFTVFGRLRDGVTLDQAGSDMNRIAGRIAEAYPQYNEGITARLRTFVEDDTGPELTAHFGAMQVATFLVLLIAIANVANLLMARATLRIREAAVRNALGASRFRTVLPFFAETLVLAAIGAVVGVGIAYVGVSLFDRATMDVGKPYYMLFKLDLPVMAFIVLISIVTAVLAGLAPAITILRTDINATLKDEGRGGSGVLGNRLTKVLVTAEIALSCALLIGAGLMAKSIVSVNRFDFPFNTENVLTARIGLFETEHPTPQSRQIFFRDLEARLATIPGVQAASLTDNLPLNSNGSEIAIEGAVYLTEKDYPNARSAIITPGYFNTFDVTLLSGRTFGISDEAESQPVVIVNQSFAQRFLAGRDPIGARFAERAGRDSLAAWMTIVGVVPDLKMEGFGNDDSRGAWGYYVPLPQRDVRFVSLAVQTAGTDPMAILSQVRTAVRSVDPNLPMYNVLSMAAVVDRAGWFYQVFGTLFIVFGAAALFMATVGLYGVLSFSVSRRVREIGIRMALGASPQAVIRLVVREGTRQLGVGLAIGLVVAYFLTKALTVIMFEVAPLDPAVLTLVVSMITVVGVLASLIPARRVTREEPVAALRPE